MDVNDLENNANLPTKQQLKTHLHRFHVQHFGDATLHDQKIRIVHVHLDGTEEVDHSFIEHRSPIDEVLVFATAANTHLP